MTDTPPQPPQPPPDPVYLLLIDSRVANYQDIINSKQHGVYHVVFHVPETASSSKVLFDAVHAKIAELGVPSFTGIGLVQHNNAKPRYDMFGKTFGRMKPLVQDVQAKDPHLETWNHVTLFITMLRINYRIEYFDMMACALYSNPDWKYIIDELTRKTGVTVRASTDDTGAAALGGDWFLESHTGANLKDFYFTEAIENYNGVLVTVPGSGTGSGASKKLILIDSRIKDIPGIINSMNADTYCLVYNYFYDTPATILSKLRFLTGENRYILDQFYYEEPVLPTRMDASGNHCTPCDDFDMDSFQLLPATLQTEYLSYTMDGGENNGRGLWPFYSQSTEITIQKPVFFQRSKVDEEETAVTSYESTDMSVTALNMNYKARPYVLVSDLDEIYELAQTAGEIAVGDSVVFDCVGIIQHAVPTHNGYKLVDNGGSSPALVMNIQSTDPNLSSWTDFIGFIQSLKTVFHMTTLDMMACALYSNPDWKYIIDLLAVRENITIRASLDNTGTVLDEGNWILETNDIDLTDVYFTDKIYGWKYVLTTYIDNRLYALRWNAVMYATRSYDARLKIAAGTNNFTIETWYYETAKQTNATIVDMGTYNYTFQVRQSTNNGLAFYNSAVGWLYAESAVVPVAQWSHLAITRSGSTITFYINGVAKQTFTSAASFFSDNGTFAVGMQSPTGLVGNRLKQDSALYDLRLWSVARTATEIQMNRNRIMPANTTGLVANYLLTDNSGNLNDRTANGLHTAIQTYTAARWSNSTVPIPNIGFLINNGYSLRTDPSGGSLNAISTFDDITYTDFSGVDLSGVNFANANLTGSNFTNANLTNANLRYAVILGATLTGAITTGSSISLAIRSPTNVLQLDGADDAVDLGFPTWAYSTQFCTTMTVECWFKTTDTSNQKTYAALVAKTISGGVSGSSQFSVYMNPTGEIGFGVTNNANVGSYHNTTAQYKDTNWHHVACTYDSATRVKNIYIDGVLSRTDTAPSGFGLLSTTDQVRLVFGSDQAGVNSGTDTRQFRGSLSDIRMWNVVRSATDISNNMRQRLIGNETGLVGYWKLNQGGSGTAGWATYTRVLDSASNRAHGTLFGTTGGTNWVITTGGLSFQPRISTITLGPRAGTYSLADSSFSFIDPSSNSLGGFTYTVSPGTVATVVNGASRRKTVYATSSAVLVNFPQLTTFDFPELASLADWQIDISFTQTSNAGSWRALIGDMYNEINTQGWGLWVSNTNRIHWSWIAATSQPATISVSLNTPYVLTVLQSSGTITLTLRTVSSGATQTGSFSVGSNIMGKGPVTIGGWRNSATENFPGTISYVNVSVPTNERVVTLLSVTDGTPATVTATQEEFGGLESGTKTANFAVIAEAMAGEVSPTIGALIVPSKNFGDASFNLTAPTSNSSGAFTYTIASTTPQVATVTPEGIVTILAAGTTTITATQAASGYYMAGAISASFVVSPAAPTIGALSSHATVLGDASFNMTVPTSNSSGAITFTSSTPAVATVTSGGSVTIVGAGTTIITATQAATANYTSGTVTSAIVVSYSKPFVLQMNGTNNGVNLGVPTWCYSAGFRSTMTVECWFKTTDTANQRANSSLVSRWFSGGSSSTSVFNLVMGATGTINAWLTNAGNVGLGVSSTTTYKDTLWHHAAMTYNSATGTLSLYIDGVLNGSTTNASFSVLSSSESTRLVFGSDDAGITSAADRQFRGFLSDIRMWNVVRSAADISNNMRQRLVGNESGLVGYWKLHQGYTTGWGTLTVVSDSTTNRFSGGIGGPVSWVLSTGSLSFQPRMSSFILGEDDGRFSLTNGSFSFTDPSSNSLGDFTYTVSPGTVATVANGASTRKTIYATSGGSVTIPTLTTFDFPELSSLPSWQIDISFTQTSNAGSARALIGDYQNEINTRGWGLWVSSSNRIHWSWSVATAEPTTISVSLNTSYVLTAAQSGGTITLTLRTVSSGAIQTGSFSVGSNIMGKGPVTIGGWRNSATDNFTGTISYVNVSVPTNERVVTLLSVTGETPATVTATQIEYAGLESATKSSNFTVVGFGEPTKAPTIGALSVPAKNFGDVPFNLTTPTSNSTGAFVFTSSEPSVATVTTDGAVTIIGGGTTTITATQASATIYISGSVTASLVVSPIAPTIGALSSHAKVLGDASFNMTVPTSNSSGAFTFTSSAPAVATVTSGGRVVLVDAGTTTITATQAATANYTSRSVTSTISVSYSKPFVLQLNGWTSQDNAVNVGLPSYWTTSNQIRETLTIECWFKTTDTNNQQSSASLVSRWGVANNNVFKLGMGTTGIISATVSNNQDVWLGLPSATTYKDTLWHHAAMTYTSATGVLSLYIDGVLNTSITNATLGTLTNTTATTLRFGSDHAGGTQADRRFRGFLSDIRIWNVVRSAADISNNYQRRLVGNESGLVGYWKLNQGYTTGWGTKVGVTDSTANRSSGSIIGVVSWVLSTGSLSFQPNISAITLGPRNGIYALSDNSFSFIDPHSNNLSDFTYAISPGTVATLTNGASTRKNIYEISHIIALPIPILTTFDFPEISSIPNWQIDISFTATATGGSFSTLLIGDMLNEVNNDGTNRGWAIWITPDNKIVWGGILLAADRQLGFSSIVLNTPYVLSVLHSGGTITATLQRVSTQVTETESFANVNSSIGKGPVTIGGVRLSSSHTFVGTISYVSVSVPSNSRIVTLLSSTGGTPETITASQIGYAGLESGTKTASLTVLPYAAFEDQPYVLTMDGVNDAVDVGIPAWSYSPDFLNKFTIECWFKTMNTANQKTNAALVSKSNVFNLFMAPSGTINIWLYGQNSVVFTITSTSTYKDARWHHVAVSYNSASRVVLLYIDGVLSNATIDTTVGILVNNTTSRVIFGNTHDGTSPNTNSDRQFRGYLSDIRVWNVIRPATSISSNYRRRLLGNESGLVGYWKLNQGYGTGWGSYSSAVDSTSNRVSGSLVSMTSPSSNWVISNQLSTSTGARLSFEPRISRIKLGANNGYYRLIDNSFSFIDPSSNSWGEFTYTVNPINVATVTNGAATRKLIYENNNLSSLPVLSTYEFPEISSILNWHIDISFTMTSSGGAASRALIGSMYNEINPDNTLRGWGIWVGPSNTIVWGGVSSALERDLSGLSVSLNTAYVLSVSQSNGTTITVTLRRVSTQAIQTASFSFDNSSIGKGPVSIGGWQNTSYASQNFLGTISYVTVAISTFERIVTLLNPTGAIPAIITATQAGYAGFIGGTMTAKLRVLSYASSNDYPLVFKLDGHADGAPLWTESGNVDAAINIGIPSWWTQAPKQILSTITVECWFKTLTTNNQQSNAALVTRWGVANNNVFSLGMGTTGIISATISNNQDVWSGLSSASTYNDTLWHHAAITYTSATGVLSLYIDGVFNTSITNATLGTLTDTATTTLRFGTDHIGGMHPIYDRTFRGFLSDVRIWNTRRSAADISNNYQRRLVGNEPGLVGYWKLNQDGTNVTPNNWDKYNIVLDATNNRSNGSIIGTLIPKGGTWALSTGNLPFQPNLSALTLGPKNGVYTIADSSFSFIDPSSNSLGDFVYDVEPETIATVTNGSSTRKIIYTTSGGSVTIPTLTTFDFPEIASLADWQIDISFTQTGVAGSFRALIGDYQNEINTRGWGLWVSSSNRIHWSWSVATAEPTTISVSLNTPYVLTVLQSSGTITMTLRTVSSGAIQTGSFSVGSNIMGKGPVTIGGWRNSGTENFTGTISYVNVSVPTVERTVTLLSSTNETPTSVTAVQLGSSRIESGIRTASLVAAVLEPTISPWTLAGVSFEVPPFPLTDPSSNSTGAFSYESLTPSVATVSGRTVTVVSVGSATIRATQDASGAYSAGSVTALLAVTPINPIISPWVIADMVFIANPLGSGENLELPNVVFGVGPITITDPSSNSLGAFSYESLTPSVATISGNIMTIVRTGTATVKATQQAYGNYNEGSMTATFTVSPAAPTISPWTIADVSFGVAPFTLTRPSSDSSGAFAYTSLNTSVATVSGNTVTVLSVGTATIRATQDACGNYLGGVVDASFAVSPIAPTYQPIAQITKTYSTDVSFSLTSVMSGVSNSSGAYTFSSTSAAIDICGGVATILAYTPSAITITATQAASGNYNASGTTTFTLLVNRKVPSYGTFSIDAATYEDAPFSIAPYAPSTDNVGVPFTYTSSEPTVATINTDGTVVTIIGQGYTTITASQAAGGNYAANSTTTSFLVNRAAPTFLKAFTIPNKTFGDASFSLLPFTEGLDNTDGTYHFTSSNAQLVSISEVDGITATILAYTPTPITIYVAIDACGNYAASSTSGTLTVARATPTIGDLTALAKSFGVSPFTLTDPSSNSTGAFSYESLNTSVATVSGNTVTVVGAGSATIQATQAANGNYNSRIVTVSLVVSPIAPTISPWTIADVSFGVAPFALTRPSSDSSGAFAYTSLNTAVATVSGNTVTVVGAGTATIRATQDACGNYLGGVVDASFAVSPIAPTISPWTIAGVSFGVAPFTLTRPSSDSSGAFAYTSLNTAVATVSGNTVTVVGAGTATIRATQDACGNYLGGVVDASFAVSPIAPTISPWTIAGVNFGVAPFALTRPSSDSSGAFAYTSLNTAVATVSGNTITVVRAGTATIRATQDACGNYLGGVVDASFAVSPIAPTISPWTIAGVSFGVAPFTLTRPSSDSSGAFAYTSLNTAVATVSGNTVTVLSVGTATIRATQDACGNYAAGTVSASLVVSAALSNFTVSPKFYGVLPFDLTDPTSTDTSVGFTFTSGNPTVATIGGVGGRTVSIVGVGSSIITATQAATENRNQLDISATLVVSPATPVITLANITKTYGDTSFRIQPSSTNTDTVGGNVFSFSSDNIAVVSFLDASLVRINGVGTARISITQAASANFTDSSGSVIITVNKGASGFTSSTFLVPTNKTYGDPSFNIITSPSSFSNGSITYEPSNPSVASINNSGVITLVGAGTVYFIASQAATALYNAETKNSNTLTVARKTVTLERITQPNGIITKSYADPNFTVVASNESNGTLSYSSGNPSLAQVNSSTGVVSIVGIGTTTITATTTETAQYALSSTSWTLEISRGLLAANNLSSSSFVVASRKINTDSPFSIITAPTSNSSAPIVYASTNTSVATIHPSTGVITLTGTTGFSRFTASQAITETHESGSITSNQLFVDRNIDFTLPGLNQTLSLTELAALDAASIALGTSDATAVMYVRVSDMLELFQYQSDSFDINNVSSSDVKYYVFHHKLPNELKLNPSHAMMNKAESIGMLGVGQGYNDNRSLVKHDFIRYVATRLFNTIHGVDLFQNENDLRENVTYMGEIVRNSIQDLLSEISTTSANESMPYDASGNKYLTNDASGNTNLGRELMRQIAYAEPSRFYNNGDNNAMLKNVPLKENDTILFKLTIASAEGQNMLTGVTEIPPRTYNIKLVLKNTVSSITNANTIVDDSDMYSTSYAYSPSVTTYAPTSVSSNVYNPYSPPAPIPFSRFGFNGWYYTNSTTWVNISPEVNNRVKWAVPANTPGSSTVGHLQYARVNLKIFNKSALPYLVIYTQSGSSRKYAIASPNSLTTGGKYSFYINFNSYSREPANIGYTNAEMTYSGSGSGSFADNEVITSLALETSDNLATGAVEFTLAAITVGELVAPSVKITEKEYGFSARVPMTYP